MKDKELSGPASPIGFYKDANGQLNPKPLMCDEDGYLVIGGEISGAGKKAANVLVKAGAKTDVFATQTGDATPVGVPYGIFNSVFEASFTSTDAASCTIMLFGTNESGDITNGLLLGTFSLSTLAAGSDKQFGTVTRPYGEVYAVIADSLGTITAIDLNWVG